MGEVSVQRAPVLVLRMSLNHVRNRIVRLPGFRLLTLAVLVHCVAMVSAQPDGLAKDFEKLSAKERARIAKEEQQSAANDAPYQAVMTEAEGLFQAQQYDASLAKFQEARAMRPYNVYPKVKIQDLQALIAKRDAEQIAAKQEQAHIEETPPPIEDHPIADPGTSSPDHNKVQASDARGTSPTDRSIVTVTETPPVEQEERKTIPAQRRAEPKIMDPTDVDRSVISANEPEEHLEVGERVYKEGRSIVVEQRIAENGRVVVYRKVTHPWGGIDHFRDGQPVTGRVYEQALETR